MAVAAVVVGVTAVVAAALVLTTALVRGPRPEEDAARGYLEAVFSGDAEASYAATTPLYRSVVLPAEHAELVQAIHRIAGDRADIEVIGSERSIGTAPPESIVGYRGNTAVGTVEGLLTLLEVDGRWWVADLSTRFPEAPPGETAELEALRRHLNQQVADRLD